MNGHSKFIHQKLFVLIHVICNAYIRRFICLLLFLLTVKSQQGPAPQFTNLLVKPTSLIDKVISWNKFN